MSRKVLGALADVVWSAATATATATATAAAAAAAVPAPSPTRLEFVSDVANVTRQIAVINDVANCFDDEFDFPDTFLHEPDWSAAVAPPFPRRSEFGSDPLTATRQIGTVNNVANDVARFVSPLCCVLHDDISEANTWIIYR